MRYFLPTRLLINSIHFLGRFCKLVDFLKHFFDSIFIYWVIEFTCSESGIILFLLIIILILSKWLIWSNLTCILHYLSVVLFLLCTSILINDRHWHLLQSFLGTFFWGDLVAGLVWEVAARGGGGSEVEGVLLEALYLTDAGEASFGIFRLVLGIRALDS